MPSMVVTLEPEACPGQYRAGFDGPAVDMHDTGAALAGIAADMGAGEVEILAQDMDQQRPVLDFDRDGLAVHRQFDCRHVLFLPDGF